MDLQASCQVMREYIQRRFRDKLNDEKIGDSFVFMVVQEEKESVLSKADEPVTYAQDYTTVRIDNNTMQGANSVVIIPEAGVEEWVEIPEFPEENDRPPTAPGGHNKDDQLLLERPQTS